jgi:hypothetical protein
MASKKTELGWEDIDARFRKPFDTKDIKWKPQTVDYKNNTATAAAHADPRAYIDRLNEVVGSDNWETRFSFTTTPYVKTIKAKKGYGDNPGTPESTETGNKVVCVCELRILGTTHSSTGDENCSDENAATNAEAQAFKRACMTFGIGRYLYSLPLTSFPFDSKTRQFIQKPTLPDWAIPKQTCDDCKQTIAAGNHNGMDISIMRLVENSQKKYAKDLCMPCQKKRAESPAQTRGITDAK